MSESTELPQQVTTRAVSVGPAILLVDMAGKVAAANQSAQALWQTGPDELVGESFSSLFALDVVTDDQEWLEAQWEILLGATLERPTELSIQPREGAPRQMSVKLEKALGTPAGYIAVIAPLPERTNAPAREESIPGLSLLTDKGPAGFFDLNLKTGRFHSSPAWRRMLGYSEGELPETYDSWLGLIHPEDTAAAPDQIGRKLTVGTRNFSVEFRMRHRLGHWVWIQCLGVQILAPDGSIERVSGLNLDISERKELEEASIANDARLQDMSGTGPLGAFEIDFAAKLFWFSPVWNKLLGYPEREVAEDASALSRALPPDEQTAGPAAWLQARIPGQLTGTELVRLHRKDGKEICVFLGLQKTLNRKKELIRVVGFICQAPANMEALAGEPVALPPALADEAFGAVAEGIIASDARGRILYANSVAGRLLRVENVGLVGRTISDCFKLVSRQSNQSVDPIDLVLSTDGKLGLLSDHALVSPNESELPTPIVWTARVAYGTDAKPKGVVVIFRDPEEMSLSPDELVKANRFESLGLLAGGISHDFNNLLTTILGGISVAKDNRDYTVLEDAEKACVAAKGLTKQLLAFAKGSSAGHSPAGSKEILLDAVKIAASGSPAQIDVSVPEGIEPIMVDRGQILQVFQNLIINALQAMPPPPHKPRIQLKACSVKVAEGQYENLKPGDYVQFEVRDNGSGIKPEYIEKIWDPFFTTKKHGTGLGLATVLSIVRRHGGEIGLDSVLGTGTAFTIFLPVADKPAEVQARRAASLRFGTGRILFMDDDEKICALSASMLQSLDYKFDIAKNGEEAIALYKRYLNIGRPYDAVLMDLTVIGGMGGEEAFHALRALDPDLRAIISSGYDNDDMAKRYLEMGFCGYLTKPYRVADLGKVLKAVLG